MSLSTTLDLRWADTDQYGHVNNVAIVRLVEEARIRLLGLPDKPEQFPPGRAPVLAVLGTSTFTMAAGQRVEYLTEMPYLGHAIRADAWLSRIGKSSITMDCRLLADQPDSVPYAIARVTVVVMDIVSRRPRPLTDDEITRLTPYRGDPLAFRD